jgi:hypothetical protein
VDAQVGGDVRNRTAALERQPHATLKQRDRKQCGRCGSNRKDGTPLTAGRGGVPPAASQAVG